MKTFGRCFGEGGVVQQGSNLNLAFTSASSFSVAENQLSAATVTANLPDTTFEILAVDDGAAFVINGGIITPVNSYDYTAKSSYLLTVRATKGSLTKDQVITINITDVPYNEEIIKIGNLVYGKYNWDRVITPMGNVIPEVTDNAAFAALTTPAWCHVNNSADFDSVYGLFFNGYAIDLIANDIAVYNVANPANPYPWDVPTKAEYEETITYLGGATVAGGHLKEAGETLWFNPNNADNSAKFSARPAGRRGNVGTFIAYGGYGYFYTKSVSGALMYRVYMSNAATTVTINADQKVNGLSLRMKRIYPIITTLILLSSTNLLNTTILC